MSARLAGSRAVSGTHPFCRAVLPGTLLRYIRYTIVGCALFPLLSGCSIPFFHRHNKDAGCHEKPFSLNTDNRPPLKTPEGLSAPDTRSAVRIPELETPERVRAKSEPCLSKPPSYFGSAGRPAAAPGQPPGAPAPASPPGPAPATAPSPQISPAPK